MTEGNWSTWFPSETEAWHDYHDQLRKRGNVRSPLGVAVEGYKRVKHPRDLNEPWYVDPERHQKPRKGYLERREEEDAGRGPPLTQEQVRAGAGEYLRLVGKERKCLKDGE